MLFAKHILDPCLTQKHFHRHSIRETDHNTKFIRQMNINDKGIEPIFY